MYCIRCGKENADDAAFCQKCGHAFEAEEETRVAQRDRPLTAAREHDLPTQIFSVTPTMKFVYVGYVITIVVSFLVAAIVGTFAGLTPPGVVAVGISLVLAALIIPAYFHLKKKLVRYTLTDTTVEIDRGLISRTTQNIPLRRIQDVTVSATAFQRLLGFGDLIIDNASEDGGKVVLDDIDSPKKYAEMMLRQMRQLER
ncbi:MAG TPA: PH domain-containing protein [Pyrinomonadaceae bacterium]|nr:PH domain-containing protein [Pyrinomonadaceae bacterium]